MNITPLSDRVTVQPTTKNISIKTLVERYGTYDLNAPYQRDECWSSDLNEKLILSILNEIPIGVIHLVRKEDGLSSWILDAKQRTTAIHKFYKNEFRVEVFLDNMAKERLTYQQMLDHSNPKVKALVMKFQDSQLTVVEWPFMEILQQAEIFEQINSMSTLSVNEDIYCVRFLAKEIINYIFDSSVRKISRHFKQKNQRENIRFAGTRVMHQILCCLSYNDFGVNQLNLSKFNMIKSSQYLHNKYLDTFGKKIEIDDSSIAKLGYGELFEIIVKACQCIQICFDSKGDFSRKLTSSDLQDIIVGLSKKIQEKKLTVSCVKENATAYYDMIVSFIELKNKEGDLTAKTLDKTRLDRRSQLFEKAYNDLSVDTGYKNTVIKDKEKSIARLRSSGQCPVCNVPLTDNNINIDHVNPKSKNSNTVAVAICKNCNLDKSDMSKNKAQDLFEFMNNYN